MQTKVTSQGLPSYAESNLLWMEMALFQDWLGQRHCDWSFSNFESADWNRMQTHLVKSALAQPQRFVHRDYHSRNLMFTEQQPLGVLDFQDAVLGPFTYDAVSLLRDCYVRWEPERVREWQRAYFLMCVQAQQLSQDEWPNFVRAMDFMGAQRHLKAAGIFARLYHRDGKAGYLADIPTTLGYLFEISSVYSELTPLAKLVEKMQQRFDEVR
jgi:aminoglycoside/choline kinase family phosphotransferase